MSTARCISLGGEGNELYPVLFSSVMFAVSLGGFEFYLQSKFGLLALTCTLSPVALSHYHASLLLIITVQCKWSSG